MSLPPSQASLVLFLSPFNSFGKSMSCSSLLITTLRNAAWKKAACEKIGGTKLKTLKLTSSKFSILAKK